MTQRERVSAVGVLAVVLVAALGFVGYQFYWVPLEGQQLTLATLQEEGQKKKHNIDAIVAQKPLLLRWRQVSLPPDTDVARREYEKYLSELMRKSGFSGVAVTSRPPDTRNAPTLPNKQHIYVRLTFAAEGKASLASIVKMMEGFYGTPLLHQIKQMNVQRPLTVTADQRREELTVTMIVEGLVVTGAPSRKFLMPPAYVAAAARAVGTRPTNPGDAVLTLWTAHPTGPLSAGPLARPPESYDAIGVRDIFLGPQQAPPPSDKPPDFDYLRFTRLTDITDTGLRTQAFLYDVSTNKQTRLRTSTAFNRFALLNSAGGNTLIHGVVKRIDKRDLVFRVELAAKEPESSGKRHYPDRTYIYMLHRDDVEELVRDKAVKREEAPRLFWIDRELWDSLLEEKKVELRDGSAFSFYGDLVRGKVIRKEPTSVILRLDEKYCAFAPGGGWNGRPKPHEGFCRMIVGDVLRDALARPLPDAEAKELRSAKAADAGEGQN